MSRKRVDKDYYGQDEQDPTARYHDEPSFCELDPLGDLFDDDFEDDDGEEE